MFCMFFFSFKKQMIENNYIKRTIADLKQRAANEGSIITETDFELDEEERINQEARNYRRMSLVDLTNLVSKVMSSFKHCFIIPIYSFVVVFPPSITMIMSNVGTLQRKKSINRETYGVQLCISYYGFYFKTNYHSHIG